MDAHPGTGIVASLRVLEINRLVLMPDDRQIDWLFNRGCGYLRL
jgi:hypothetical protein